MDIIEVLKYIADNPETGSKEISEYLNISLVDAAVRLNKLKVGGSIKRANDDYPYQYIITQFGKNYLDYRQDNPPKKKQWHGMIPKEYRKK